MLSLLHSLWTTLCPNRRPSRNHLTEQEALLCPEAPLMRMGGL